jgi:hypothetical protein
LTIAERARLGMRAMERQTAFIPSDIMASELGGGGVGIGWRWRWGKKKEDWYDRMIVAKIAVRSELKSNVPRLPYTL